MAKVEQLPYGAIAPSAKPVSAFIAPGKSSIAGPPIGQATFGNPGQLSTIQQAGTTYVQGANSFKQLAQDLGAFNQAFSATAPKAAAAFAQWQMEQGLKEARGAIAEAQTRLDEEIETSELNRAAANRQVAFEDPQAGGLMNWLNPYRRIGFERGLAKQAGIEIEQGMPGYIARNGNFDYNSPDQGFAQLNKVRADFTNQILDKYGIDDQTPGFNKYVAPRIERASDRAAQALNKDRIEWFDAQKPTTIASLIKAEWAQINSTGSVTFNGQTYTPAMPGFNQAIGLRLNQIASNELMTAGLPGQARGWMKDAYQILAAERDFNKEGVSPLDYLTTQQLKQGADGKPVTDRYGNPQYYSWNELFAQESIDSQIKYGQAAYTLRNKERQERATFVKGVLVQETMGMAAGAQRYAAGQQKLKELIDAENTQRQQQGLAPLSPADEASLYEAWQKANELTLDIRDNIEYTEEANLFLASIGTTFGDDFDATEARQRVAVLAAGLPEKDAKKFRAEAETAITAKEKQEDVVTNYGKRFNPIIESRTQQFLLREYRMKTPRTEEDWLEAELNFKQLANQVVQEALSAEEARLDRRLDPLEAVAVARKAMDSLTPEQLLELAPNGRSQKAANERQQTIQSQIESGKPEAKPPTPTYDTNQLADIPDRQVVLRQFRTVPILSESAVEQVVIQQVPSTALKKAWRDAGAASLWDFVEAQEALLKQQNPEWVPSYTPAQRRQFRDRSLQSAGLEKSIFTTQQLTASRPQLASIQGWIVPTLLEV